MPLSERERLAQLGAKQTNNPVGTNPPKFEIFTPDPDESTTVTIPRPGMIVATYHRDLNDSDVVELLLPNVEERTCVAVISDYGEDDAGTVNVYHNDRVAGGIDQLYRYWGMPGTQRRLFNYDPSSDTWWVI